MTHRVEQFETRALRLELARRELCAEGRLPGYVPLRQWLRAFDRLTPRL